MASNYNHVYEEVVSSSSDDDFSMDTETFQVCDQGHLFTTGTPDDCWTCRRNELEQERRRSNEKVKIDLYRLYLKCGVGNEEMMGVLHELEEEEETGGQLFRTFTALLETGDQYHRQMDAKLREWMDPVQDEQISSSTGSGARQTTAAQQDLTGLYHGFNMIKKGEGYHCLCGQRFDDDLDLFLHLRNVMANHSGSAVCICSVCGKKLRTCGGLRVHSRKEHKEVLQQLWRSARK